MKEKETRETERERERDREERGARNIKCLGPHLFLPPAALSASAQPIFFSSRRLFNVILWHEDAVGTCEPAKLEEFLSVPSAFSR